ncbi:MAG: hypothetical protein U9O94_10835 [Nanoarchaeota archaeon]|nr:hypothetical protein [Nanoarchaeota archaeon]
MKDIKDLKKEVTEDDKKTSDWILFGAIGIIILILAGIIGFKLIQEETPKTIDDLHALNLEGKLKPDQGYIYNGYSFVYNDGLWHTQVKKGDNLFYIALHYAPKELEEVPSEGYLDAKLFDSSKFIYYTFNPLESELKYVTVAAGEFVRNMIAAFNKIPKAACAENETKACEEVPILRCDNTNLPLIYFQQETPLEVVYEDNCIIVKGVGMDVVKATDKMLLTLYGIME